LDTPSPSISLACKLDQLRGVCITHRDDEQMLAESKTFHHQKVNSIWPMGSFMPRPLCHSGLWLHFRRRYTVRSWASQSESTTSAQFLRCPRPAAFYRFYILCFVPLHCLDMALMNIYQSRPNEDPRDRRRTVPMQVLNLSFPRTGSMCAFRNP